MIKHAKALFLNVENIDYEASYMRKHCLKLQNNSFLKTVKCENIVLLIETFMFEDSYMRTQCVLL